MAAPVDPGAEEGAIPGAQPFHLGDELLEGAEKPVAVSSVHAGVPFRAGIFPW